MNKNSVAAVHILSSRDEMDRAKEPCFPGYGAVNTCITRLLLTNTDGASNPDPLCQYDFGESSRIHILNKHLHPPGIISMKDLRTIGLILNISLPSTMYGLKADVNELSAIFFTKHER